MKRLLVLLVLAAVVLGLVSYGWAHCVEQIDPNYKQYMKDVKSGTRVDGGKSAPAPAAAAQPAEKPAPAPTTAPAAVVAPAAVAAPADSDRDGVADSMDKCPGTPEGVKVDANGCPVDSDNDGVADHLDKCPGTPAGVKVDANGCPVDSDNDGVADHFDKCPGTPADAKVDSTGCVVSITLKVNFDGGKAVVKQEYIPEIEKFSQFLKQYPDVRAEIQGHTDNRGGAKQNKALSEARAKAVRDAVVKFGISADRLSAKGYGQDKPVATNDTPEGREKNRRVDAVIVK